jgi:3-dehydroquinate synthase
MTLTVKAREREYPLYFEEGLMTSEAHWAPHVSGRNVFIVTNTTVGPPYEPRLRDTLTPLAKSVHTVNLPDGEAYKNSATLDIVYNHLLTAKADRKTVLVALGGGVVGDMTGFAAATYQRGIEFIQAPTTLLAMVDSSIGGKTGINHPLGKNMIGAFHAPVAVMADINSLTTLPNREYAAGLAEVVKHALIADPAYLQDLEQHAKELTSRDAVTLQRVIRRSCAIKADIVARDEHETLDLRALLNLGHTFGHAIETEMGYGSCLHGEAVAMGLILAMRYSVRLGHLPPSAIDRLATLLETFGLPTTPPSMTPGAMLNHMGRDKKNQDGRIRLVLLRSIGEGYVEPRVDQTDLEIFLKQELPSAKP